MARVSRAASGGRRPLTASKLRKVMLSYGRRRGKSGGRSWPPSTRDRTSSVAPLPGHYPGAQAETVAVGLASPILDARLKAAHDARRVGSPPPPRSRAVPLPRFAGLRAPHRQVDDEAAAAAGRGFARCGAAVALSDLAHQRQAEAPAAGKFGPAGGTIERLEHPLALRRGDPFAGVGDDDARHVHRDARRRS